MPFTLAHPAAVLPLRRFCPKRLTFFGLVIGSLVPDVAYFFDDICPFPSLLTPLVGRPAADVGHLAVDLQWSDFSHSLYGSLLLALPVGYFLFVIFHLIAAELVSTLPNPYRKALHQSCRQPRPSIAVGVSSVAIGIWLHLVWDSFTHRNSWLAQNCAFLHRHVLNGVHGGLEVITVFWIFSSVGGLIALLASGLHFVRKQRMPLWAFAREDAGRYFFWVTLLSIPLAIAIPITIHFTRAEIAANRYSFIFHVFSEYYLVTLGLCVIAVGFAYKQKNARPDSGT